MKFSEYVKAKATKRPNRLAVVVSFVAIIAIFYGLASL